MLKPSSRRRQLTAYITATLGGKSYYWIGNTVRDEYAGIFFGLGVAYDAVEDSEVRSEIREITTRLLDFLLRNNWAVVMPDGRSQHGLLGSA